ncbi:hypothetical protein R3P38DRAFT_3227909 [Favolaschia claudopus]|uniref:Uncharacterized protein n=1 Tax=Favolaschia claudopus TaxID=2862362 RepID=A0AAV9ZRD5_9AGAR
MEHVFPHLLTLGVEFYEIRPDFWASLARSSHLEMLIVRGWTWKPVIDNKWKNGRRANVSLPVQLYMAAPSLRILHFHHPPHDSHAHPDWRIREFMRLYIQNQHQQGLRAIRDVLWNLLQARHVDREYVA